MWFETAFGQKSGAVPPCQITWGAREVSGPRFACLGPVTGWPHQHTDLWEVPLQAHVESRKKTSAKSRKEKETEVRNGSGSFRVLSSSWWAAGSDGGHLTAGSCRQEGLARSVSTE